MHYESRPTTYNLSFCAVSFVHPVKEDLEAQSRALSMPRRSKSNSVSSRTAPADAYFNGQFDRHSPTTLMRSNTSTPQSIRRTPSTKERRSDESSASHGAPAGSPPRSSNEKSRLRMFGGGRSTPPASQQDKGGAGSSSGHRRTGSESMEESRASEEDQVSAKSIGIAAMQTARILPNLR